MDVGMGVGVFVEVALGWGVKVAVGEGVIVGVGAPGNSPDKEQA